MNNQNLKIKETNKRGRRKYQPNVEQLKELYKQVEDKTITNEEGWRQANCKKTKWYELKKLYATKGVNAKWKKKKSNN